MARLPRSFFARPTLEVARALLGQRLVRLRPPERSAAPERLAGLIVETEAYVGQEDLGCHARAGVTARNKVMFGPPGHAYVYFTYGMHWMLNFVTEADGFPAAVLVRAIVPVSGVATMRRLRSNRPEQILTNGPAKLTQALDIDRGFNDCDLCAAGARLYVEAAPAVPEVAVTYGPRIGLNQTPEPWKSLPWNMKVSVDALAVSAQGRIEEK
jgi:DNA-3-methyladenine glycosylase